MNDMIQSGAPLLIAALIGVLLICWFLYSLFKGSRENVAQIQESEARLAVVRAARPPAPIPSVAPGSGPPILRPGGTNPALAWNVVVIVVGVLIAIIGLINGLAADPQNSALRQTVSALWMIQGILGLLIAAVGILGAGLFHAIERFDPARKG